MINYRQPFRGIRMTHEPEREPEVRQLRSALIVDDHPLFCDALSMTLTGPVGLERVESVGTLQGALKRLAGPSKPDVIVLDPTTPG